MIWYVNSAIGSDANDGRSPRSAFKTFAHAVQAAKPGDSVVIAPGAYDQDLAAQVGPRRQARGLRRRRLLSQVGRTALQRAGGRFLGEQISKVL
jgi:uncharacterized protein DUF1565